MQNMSILHTTLKMVCAATFSTFTGLKLNGQRALALRLRFLSKDLLKSEVQPPQLILVASKEVTLSKRATRATLFLTTGTSLPQ